MCCKSGEVDFGTIQFHHFEGSELVVQKELVKRQPWHTTEKQR